MTRVILAMVLFLLDCKGRSDEDGGIAVISVMIGVIIQ